MRVGRDESGRLVAGRLMNPKKYLPDLRASNAAGRLREYALINTARRSLTALRILSELRYALYLPDKIPSSATRGISL